MTFKNNSKGVTVMGEVADLQAKIREQSQLINKANTKIAQNQQESSSISSQISIYEQEIENVLEDYLKQAQIIDQREREQWENALRSFSHHQRVMKDEIIKLNESLRDTTHIQSLYDIKTAQLETSHLSIKTSLEREESALKTQIRELEDEIHDLKKEKESISWRKTLKELSQILTVFFGLGIIYGFIGTFLGWGVSEIIQGFWNVLVDIWNAIIGVFTKT